MTSPARATEPSTRTVTEAVHPEVLGVGRIDASRPTEQLIGIVSHDLRNPLNTITRSAATLEVCSTGAEGTRFCVRLPRAA